jgi:hypothetical protein
MRWVLQRGQRDARSFAKCAALQPPAISALTHLLLQTAERRLTVALVVVEPLRIEQVVHRDDVVVLAECAGAHAAQLLHVSADAEQEAEVHAERADVRAGLARDPEDGEVALIVKLEQLGLVDGADAQLALDGTDERRALEEGAGERLEGARQRLDVGQRIVQTQHGHVLLARALLRLDEARGTVDADDETAGDLGVQRARVARLLDAQHAPDPRHDFVRRRVRRLVQVDHTRLDVRRQLALQRRAAVRDGREVRGAHEQLVLRERRGRQQMPPRHTRAVQDAVRARSSGLPGVQRASSSERRLRRSVQAGGPCSKCTARPRCAGQRRCPQPRRARDIAASRRRPARLTSPQLIDAGQRASRPHSSSTPASAPHGPTAHSPALALPLSAALT